MSDIITTSLQAIAEELHNRATGLLLKETKSQGREIAACATELASIVNSDKVELTAEELIQASRFVELAGKWPAEGTGKIEAIVRCWGQSPISSHYSAFSGYEDLFTKVYKHTEKFKALEEEQEVDRRAKVDELFALQGNLYWNGSSFDVGNKCYSVPVTDYRKDEVESLKIRAIAAFQAKKAEIERQTHEEFELKCEVEAEEEKTYRKICKHFYGLEGEDFEQVSKSSLNAKVREELQFIRNYERTGRTPYSDTVPAKALVIYKELIKDLTSGAKDLAKAIGIPQRSVAFRRVSWGNQGRVWTADFAMSFGGIGTIRFSEVVLLPEDYSPEEEY